MIDAKIMQALQMANECFGVGVTSEPRMASAGVELWMGSSTDKHLPRSTTCATHSVILNRVASQMRA